MMWDSALGMTCAQDWRSTWLGGGPTTTQSREDPKSCIVMVSGFGLDPTDISITVPAYTPRSPRHKSRLAGIEKSTIRLTTCLSYLSLLGGYANKAATAEDTGSAKKIRIANE